MQSPHCFVLYIKSNSDSHWYVQRFTNAQLIKRILKPAPVYINARHHFSMKVLRTHVASTHNQLFEITWLRGLGRQHLFIVGIQFSIIFQFDFLWLLNVQIWAFDWFLHHAFRLLHDNGKLRKMWILMVAVWPFIWRRTFMILCLKGSAGHFFFASTYVNMLHSGKKKTT